jgi:hypothetical protein
LKTGVWKLDLDAAIPTIKWGFVIKNNSLFPISLAGEMRGHLHFEGHKLLEQRTVVTNDILNLGHLKEGTYTCEQRLSRLEADLITNNRHGKFSFQGLEIKFKGGDGFDQIQTRQLVVPDSFKVELDQIADKASQEVAKSVEPITKERDTLKIEFDKLVEGASAPPGNLVINSARYGVPGTYEEDVEGILSGMIVNNTLCHHISTIVIRVNYPEGFNRIMIGHVVS